MVRLFIIFVITCFYSSYSLGCEELKLFGEIEKKHRQGKKIISQKKFVPVPKVMSPNSSEFSRLSIKGPSAEEVEINYQSAGKVVVKEQSFQLSESIVEKFDFKNFEKSIEAHRPGKMSLKFSSEGKVICTKFIRFIGGD